MTREVLEITGFEELLKALEERPEVARPLVEKALQKSLAMLHECLAVYPPATAANRPGRMRVEKRKGRLRQVPAGYYERGRGWWSPLKSAQSLGEKLGVRHGALTEQQAAKRTKTQANSRLAGYRLHPTSERLGTKWTTQVEISEAGASGEIGTNVSYAEYVQGQKQPALFGMRGWKTLDQAIEETRPEIEKAFERAVEQLVEDFNQNNP